MVKTCIYYLIWLVWLSNGIGLNFYLHELCPGHVVLRQERELAEEGRLASEVVLKGVGCAVHGGQARHGRAHEHDAAGFRPQWPVALIPQVLHDQVHLGLVVVVKASVKH